MYIFETINKLNKYPNTYNIYVRCGGHTLGSKSYDDLHDRQRQTHKATLCNAFQSFSKDLHMIGLDLETVNIRRISSNKNMVLDIHQCR